MCHLDRERRKKNTEFAEEHNARMAKRGPAIGRPKPPPSIEEKAVFKSKSSIFSQQHLVNQVTMSEKYEEEMLADPRSKPPMPSVNTHSPHFSLKFKTEFETALSQMTAVDEEAAAEELRWLYEKHKYEKLLDVLGSFDTEIGKLLDKEEQAQKVAE